MKYPFVLLGGSPYQKEPAEWANLLDNLQSNADKMFQIYSVTEASFADL
ncbi:MAG: hypothetical protein LBT50_11950 [Prevotellaceae bacterium]|nr:hypothetical protein [Prevotellaceae bacterium]